MAQQAAGVDTTLIDDLLETIQRYPSAVEARKLVIQQYYNIGWQDAAIDASRELLLVLPDGAEKRKLAAVLDKADRDRSRKSLNPLTVHHPKSTMQPTAKDSISPLIIDTAKQMLVKDYGELRAEAKSLLEELRVLREMREKKGLPVEDARAIDELRLLADGRVGTVIRSPPPTSARILAQAMERRPDHALDIAVDDFAAVARWLGKSENHAVDQDEDAIREALSKRAQALAATLPKNLAYQAPMALMHAEHEVLQRSYVCKDTMYGDAVADIPRAQFWVSEDSYPWDMSELVAALKSNSGVMRNPLSRMMFTENDVRAIVRHPLGRELIALRVEQRELTKGVRTTTVERLSSLSAVLLADMTTDQTSSREAVDAFLAYVATLPEAEQKAINGLRVPAVDSHTLQPFDATIGEAVRDAQGNRTCFHKTGDLLRQAASHLRQS